MGRKTDMASRRSQSKWIVIALLTLITTPRFANAEMREISRAALIDKANAFWVAQLVGNYLGFPFENLYQHKPIPFFVDRYYSYLDDESIRLNRHELRGHVPVLLRTFDGAFSDDDTDIEFVTLHAVERHGLGLTYPQIADHWREHISRRIWVANRSARDLMETRMNPPETGMKINNPNWFQIDPQLVNEIWSTFYPGMIDQAAKRAEWGARITNDDWGVHPTIMYAVLLSGGYFTNDIPRLIDLALQRIPESSPFHQGVRDVMQWHHDAPDDWRATRQNIHQKYYRYKTDDYEAPFSKYSSLPNGLCGIMALLYGNGDFLDTVGIAVSAGYDCDNQAATCAAIIAVMNGSKCIPDQLTKTVVPKRTWETPFNDVYLNYTRDGLPIMNHISDIAERIVDVSELAIQANGGEVLSREGGTIYRVQTTGIHLQ
ncbi:MAG: ADP-ribosylglycohydrolase family protein [Planctomycetota bacterium]